MTNESLKLTIQKTMNMKQQQVVLHSCYEISL